MNSLFLDLLINKKKHKQKNYTVHNDLSPINKTLSIIQNNIIHKKDDILSFHDFSQLFTEFSSEFIDDYIDITSEKVMKENLVLFLLIHIISKKSFECTAIIPFDFIL